MIYRKERLDRGIKARSDDVFAVSSYREILYLVAPRFLMVAGFLLIPVIVGGYWQKVIILICTAALLGLSWDIMASTGMVCLGQAFFFGVGSYISGALNYYFHLPVYFTIPLATLSGGILCTLVLVPALRLRGAYFAMISLILPLMSIRIIEATKIFGGTEGLNPLSPIPNKWIETYVPIVIMLTLLFGFRKLIESDYGIILRGIRDNDQAVLSGGIDIYWYKSQILFVGGAVGAFIGAFMAHCYRFVGMPAFALDYSILPIACVVVGGTGNFAGAILGASILVPLSESLRLLGTMRIAFYSLFLVIFIVGIPEGIFPYLERKYHQFERMVKVEAEG